MTSNSRPDASRRIGVADRRVRDGRGRCEHRGARMVGLVGVVRASGFDAVALQQHLAACRRLTRDPHPETRAVVSARSGCPQQSLVGLAAGNDHTVRAAAAANSDCPQSSFQDLVCDSCDIVRIAATPNLVCPPQHLQPRMGHRTALLAATGQTPPNMRVRGTVLRGSVFFCVRQQQPRCRWQRRVLGCWATAALDRPPRPLTGPRFCWNTGTRYPYPKNNRQQRIAVRSRPRTVPTTHTAGWS